MSRVFFLPASFICLSLDHFVLRWCSTLGSIWWGLYTLSCISGSRHQRTKHLCLWTVLFNQLTFWWSDHSLISTKQWDRVASPQMEKTAPNTPSLSQARVVITEAKEEPLKQRSKRKQTRCVREARHRGTPRRKSKPAVHFLWCERWILNDF